MNPARSELTYWIARNPFTENLYFASVHCLHLKCFYIQDVTLSLYFYILGDTLSSVLTAGTSADE